MNTPRLIETCLEGGSLTEQQIQKALQGQVRHPMAAAVISFIEWKIGCERNIAEARGQEAQTRTEACAAAAALVDLRAELLNYLRTGTDQEEKSGTNPHEPSRIRTKPHESEPGSVG